MKRISIVLSHVTAVLSLALLVLLIFDYFNPYMQFLSSVASKIFLLILCVSSLALALLSRKK